MVAEDEFKCDACEACVEYCKKIGKNFPEISPSKELLVTIESFGQLTPEELFKKSTEVLKKDLADLSKKISK